MIIRVVIFVHDRKKEFRIKNQIIQNRLQNLWILNGFATETFFKE